MNSILKYLCFVLFGIIIYLLLRNRGKKERFSIGMQAACTGGDCINTNTCTDDTVLESWTCNGGDSPNCNINLYNELDWSTCKNPCCMPMVIDFHDQGECGTCSIYSVTSLLECMYNIKVFQENRTDELPRSSISPQSIIDILGRYRHIYPDNELAWSGFGNHDGPVYHNYNYNGFDNKDLDVVLAEYNFFVNDRSQGICLFCPESTDYQECVESYDALSNKDIQSGCGQYWQAYDSFRTLNNLKYLKDLDRTTIGSNELGQQIRELLNQMIDIQGFHYPFPLLIESAQRVHDGGNYTIMRNYCTFELLFGERIHDTIAAPDYCYTNHFTQDSFIDFKINNVNKLFDNENISFDFFKSTIKQQLINGPIVLDVELAPNIMNPDGLIDIVSTGHSDVPGGASADINHELLIIGYKDNDVILLNSFPPHITSNERPTDIQYYITNDISFDVIYNDLKETNKIVHNFVYIDIELPPGSPGNDCFSDRTFNYNLIPTPPSPVAPVAPAPVAPASDWAGFIGVTGATTVLIGAMACAARAHRKRYAELDTSVPADDSSDNP